MCESTHLRAHLHQYVLTLHTYLLHISFHKEFLIKTGSCFLWNLVLHHTLLKLLPKKKKKRKQGCYSSNSSKHLLASLPETAKRASCKLCINDVTESFTIFCLHIIFICTSPLTFPALQNTRWLDELSNIKRFLVFLKTGIWQFYGNLQTTNWHTGSSLLPAH